MVQYSVRSFVFTILLLSPLIGASGDEGGLRLDEKLRALLDNTHAVEGTGIPTDLYTALDNTHAVEGTGIPTDLY